MKGSSKRVEGRAREMRRTLTRAESRLWSWLRDRRFDGLKFRRQVPVGNYILDFYCAALRLALEVDGSQHADPRVQAADETRRRGLASLGIEVFRVTNEELIRDPVVLAARIRFAIDGVTRGRRGLRGRSFRRTRGSCRRR